MLPLAHASDGGGSIRIPSALNHLFGLKPSRGRVRNAYGLPDRHLLYTCGPIARTVEDAAAMLDVLAGLDVDRPHWLPPPPRPFARSLRDDPGKLRVGLVLESPIAPVDPRIREVTLRVARLLERIGYRVEERKLPIVSLEAFLPLWQRSVAQGPVFFRNRLQPVTRWLRDAGKKLSAAEVLRVQTDMTEGLIQAMDGLDVLLSPTVGVPTPEVGAWRGMAPGEAFAAAAALGAFTAPANVMGAPAASIPAGLLEDRWPVGVQVLALPGEDLRVLAVSRLLEEAIPWAERWSPLAGHPAGAPIQQRAHG
jgi:amidase